jgi:hypothetical protein
MTDLSSTSSSPVNTSPTGTSEPATYVDDYVPPATPVTQTAEPTTSSTPPAGSTDQKSETLQDQNIFHLLGVENATEEEKEAFLDELQQVIWEDFVESDVELLLTEEELVEFKKISQKQGTGDEQLQVEMVQFLEKLIPDLEKIMLEKALELKEEMMRERISQLKSVYKEEPEKLTKVNEALKLADSDQWHSSANMLNAISA